ncbi:MAG: glycerol-3-phosphate 1-O-acyltransferase PlsY [Bacillota bacterium]|nr:glycerol-3-phosphate 1-O-acyltransferase PlsY [Bacillota bacterium]
MQNYILLIVIGYLIGSIPFSFIVGKLLSDIDIREHGSGNAGATNAFRVLGLKGGLLSFIGDFSKGVLAVLIGKYILGLDGGLLTGLVAVIGHCYPITLNFKGGKGVATSAGIIIAVNPIMGLILIVFQFSIVYFTKYVSLASILAALLFPILSLIFKMENNFIVLSIFLALFITYRHRTNIKRLLNGTESKFKKSNN